MITSDYIVNIKGNEVTLIIGEKIPQRFIIEKIRLRHESETLELCTLNSKNDVLVQLESKHANYIWSKRDLLSEMGIVWNSSGIYPPKLKHLSGAVVTCIDWVLS